MLSVKISNKESRRDPYRHAKCTWWVYFQRFQAKYSNIVKAINRALSIKSNAPLILLIDGINDCCSCNCETAGWLWKIFHYMLFSLEYLKSFLEDW